jgi:hypothetical protein
MLTGLYTDDRRPARMVRKLALRAGARLRPFRMAVVAGLTADGGTGVRAPRFQFARLGRVATGVE